MFVIDLEELERLLRVGTPGPWERSTNPSRDTRWVNAAEGDRDIVCDLDEADVSPAQQWDNAALIVALRNAVPELIAEIRSLKETVRAAHRVGFQHDMGPCICAVCK